MAKRLQTYQTCDVCGKTNAETWLIGTPESERAKVDLCGSCERPIRKAFIAGRKSGNIGPQGADIIHTVIVDDYEPSEQAEERMRQGEYPYWSAARDKRQQNG